MNSILCVNTGSSSIKYALYLGESQVFSDQFDLDGEKIVFQEILESIPDHPDIIAHRVVHGGPEFTEATRISPELVSRLGQLIPLAPDHLPRALEVIDAAISRFPEIPQFACFDTAFHQSMPELAKRLPLPQSCLSGGARRYGFHGLSYQSVVESLADRLPGRLIIAHLGNGSSLCAVKDGVPVDTTMGFTPTGGVMMGSRCGDIDPGVILYLMREKGYGVEEINRLVNDQSGLLGVSGISPDMRELLAVAETHDDSAMAIELYCYQIRKAIGAFAAVLGGLDLLVFTGGIGENSTDIRDRIVRELDYLGGEVEVVPCNEALSMVRQVNKVY